MKGRYQRHLPPRSGYQLLFLGIATFLVLVVHVTYLHSPADRRATDRVGARCLATSSCGRHVPLDIFDGFQSTLDRLEEIGAKHGHTEGGTFLFPESFGVLNLIARRPGPGDKLYCEGGFGNGQTSTLFLEASPTNQVASFDYWTGQPKTDFLATMTEQYDSRRFEAIKGDAFSAFPAWHERNPGRTCSLVFPDFAGCVIDFAAPALCHESRFAQLFADQHADCDTLVYLDHTEHDQLPPFRIDYRFEGLVDQGVIRQLSCFYSDSDPKWTKASWLGVDGTVRQVGCVGQYVFPNDPGACPDRQTPLLPAGTPQVIPFLRDTIFADLDATLPSPSTTPLPADFRNLIDELLIVGASAAVRTTCVVGAGHGKEIAALLAISRSTKIVLFEESATTAVELVRERDGLNRIDVNRGPIAETIPKWVDDAHERCDFVVLNQVECGPYQTIDCIDHVAAMELVANAKPGAIVAVNLGYGEAGPFLSGVPSTVQMRTVGCTRGVSYRHMPGPYDHQDTQAHMCFYSI